MNALRERIAVAEKEDLELRKTVEEVRNPPFAFQCASNYGKWWHLSNAIITYDKLLYSSMFNVDGGFDIATGVFTAGYPGTWTLTASMRSALNEGEDSFIFIYHNDQKIEDSRLFTHVGSGQTVQSMTSRTLLMHLDTGDSVSLRTEQWGLGWGIADIILCVELAQFDV